MTTPNKKPLLKFTVYLSACASVEGKVVVEAENEEAALEEAVKVADSGNIVWDYNGVDGGTIEANEAQSTP